MRRGTTPTLTFTIDFDISKIVSGYITFSQNDVVILDKVIGESGVSLSEGLLSVHLTQEETLLFKSAPVSPVKVQLRLLLEDEEAIASNIIIFNAGQILKDGVI